MSKVDYHPHLLARMEQRGISTDEIERTLEVGWEATDAKPGTQGKVCVFTFHQEWQGRFYEEKEVRVYYKDAEDDLIILTAVARYGNSFARSSSDEDRI
jgi:hypothetical protein